MRLPTKLWPRTKPERLGARCVAGNAMGASDPDVNDTCTFSLKKLGFPEGLRYEAAKLDSEGGERSLGD